MTAKEFLSRPKELEAEISCDIDNLASLRSVVESYTSRLSFTAGCKAGRDRDVFENTVIDIVEEEEKIRRKVSRLQAMLIEVIQTIAKLENPDHRKLLKCRYLEGMIWENVAESVGLSKSHVYLLHREALNEMEKLIADNSKE